MELWCETYNTRILVSTSSNTTSFQDYILPIHNTLIIYYEWIHDKIALFAYNDTTSEDVVTVSGSCHDCQQRECQQNQVTYK